MIVCSLSAAVFSTGKRAGAFQTNPISALEFCLLHSPHGAVSERGMPSKMKGLIFCVFAVLMLPPAQGEEEQPADQLMDSVGLEHEEALTCFRCDLGFWDTCYTTETNCSHKELCYTGRGKAANTLDVKTLGCAKVEECGVETTVELFSNETIFVMTKHCCDTSFCNSAHKLSINTLLSLTAALLTTWHYSESSAGS